jgi:hypothetical protein
MCDDCRRARVLNTLQVKILSRSGYVNIKYDENVEREVAMFSVDDINDVITGITAYSIATAFSRLLLSTYTLSPLLPDSRAGITRTLLKPFTIVNMLLGVDAEYRDLYFRLVRWLYRNQHVLSEVKLFLKSLT